MIATPQSTAGAADGLEAQLAALAGKYMTFKLADEAYGLAIVDVREIIRVPEITRVPRSPPHVRGVINLRGRVIPVFDLRQRFGMPATQLAEQTVVIVVQFRAGERTFTLGVLVDQVLEVVPIDATQIEPPPEFAGSTQSDFILGVGKAAERVLFLLDLGRLLSDEQLQALSSAQQPASPATSPSRS